MNFPRCLSFTLGEEAGYQTNRADRGNWLGDVLVGTNLGISAPVLALWLREHQRITDPKVVAQVMRSLPITTASEIYEARYWRPVQGDALPAGVDVMLFDHGVSAGIGGSVRCVQQLVGAVADGALGPITLAAIRAAPIVPLLAGLEAAQRAAYRAMKSFPDFGRGWLARLDRRAATARRFAAELHLNTIGDQQ